MRVRMRVPWCRWISRASRAPAEDGRLAEVGLTDACAVPLQRVRRPCSDRSPDDVITPTGPHAAAGRPGAGRRSPLSAGSRPLASPSGAARTRGAPCGDTDQEEQRARFRGRAFVATSGGPGCSTTMAGTLTGPRRAVVVEDAAATTKSGKRKKADAAALAAQPGDHIVVLEKLRGSTYLVRGASSGGSR